MHQKLKGRSAMKTLTRQPIIMERKPIFLKRQAIISESSGDVAFEQRFSHMTKNPVKINLSTKRFANYTDEQRKKILIAAQYGKAVLNGVLKSFRWENKRNFTEQELEFLNTFVKYYENRVMVSQKLLVYSAIPQLAVNGRKALHWKSLWKSYQLCLENGFDYRIFIDAQFESFTNWDKKTQDMLKFPRPQNLHSERAVQAYKNYMYANEGAYKQQGFDHIVVKPVVKKFQNNENIYDKYCGDIDKSIFEIKNFLKHLSNSTFSGLDDYDLSVEEKELIKKLYAIDSLWIGTLEPAYLAIVPGFIEFYEKDKENYVGSAKEKFFEAESILEKRGLWRRIRAYAFRKEYRENLTPFRAGVKITLLNSVDKALGWENGAVDESWNEDW